MFIVSHGLSMVFGSSKCMMCTNKYILISVIVIAAGILLVVLLYLLNRSQALMGLLME